MENENYNQIKKINNQNVIIDLPQQVLKRVENTLSDNNKIILIDQTDTKIKDKVIIVPSLFIIKKIPNIYFGKDYLIIDRKLSYEFVRNKILNKKPYINLIVFGGSKKPPHQIFSYIRKQKKEKFLMIVGQYLNLKLKNKPVNLKLVKKPKNISKFISESKKIITRLGVTVYESLSLRINPIVCVSKKDSLIRKNTTNFLYKNKFVNIFGKKEQLILKKPKISFGSLKYIEIIDKYFN